MGSIISGEVKTIIGLLSSQRRKICPYRRGHLKCIDFAIPYKNYSIRTIVEKLKILIRISTIILTFFAQKDSFKYGGQNG